MPSLLPIGVQDKLHCRQSSLRTTQEIIIDIHGAAIKLSLSDGVARQLFGYFLKVAGCGECQDSCQSACKTSCTVGNQVCERTKK